MLPMTPPFRFNPGEFRLKPATERWEQLGCAALRRAVFCIEQGLFDGDDRDAADAGALSIAALVCLIGQPEQVVGTVRIHETEPGVWQGSRLAVHADYRSGTALGPHLIRHAVGSARARGCRRFLAQVQVQNAALFKRLHWQVLEPVSVCGRPHLLMEADLTHYPPCARDEVCLYPGLGRAA